MDEAVQEVLEDEATERPYPFPSQIQDHHYCYLSPPDEHRRLLVELGSSVWLKPLNNNTLPASDQLLQLLISRYGGAAPNYHISSLKQGYLVRFPDWLVPEEPLLDAAYWEHSHHIGVQPWQSINQSSYLPPSFRAIVKIHDFPVDYWHPVYFRQATSAMGEIVAIPGDVLRGQNKAFVKLLLDCYDPKLIPHRIYVGHGECWTECRVELEGRPAQPGGSDPPSPPNTGDRRGIDGPHNQPHNLTAPYMPPWRRRALQFQPRFDPSGRAAPAAQERGNQGWLTKFIPTPCSNRANEYVQTPVQKTQSTFLRESQQGYVQRTGGKDHAHSHKPLPQIQTRIRTFYCYPETPTKYPTYSSREIPILPTPAPCMPHAQHKDTPEYHAYQQLQPSNTLQTLSILGLPPLSQDIKENRRWSLMASPRTNFTAEDEALISKFVGLQTGEGLVHKVQVPHDATTSTAWELALLLKVVTDRTVLDNQFTTAMMQAWKADPNTLIRPISKNLYLAEFTSQEELLQASLGGPWTYRGDLVAHRRVTAHSDLQPKHIGFANLWVQLHNLPVNCLTEEGIDIVASELGTPVTPPVEGFVNGRRFIKVKVMISLTQPLKDHVSFTHPVLGDIKVFCSYEKVARVCRFCGGLGHEIIGCPDHQRLSVLSQDPSLNLTITRGELLSPKLGAWITNPILVPRANDSGGVTAPTAQKRSYPQEGVSTQEAHIRPLSLMGYRRIVRASEEESSDAIAIKRPRPAGPIPPATDI